MNKSHEVTTSWGRIRQSDQTRMRRVLQRDTTPEIKVRRLVHSLGYRFRLHHHELPGRPDLVFASRKKVIFVHGCFWHRHNCRRGRSMPAANLKLWTHKFAGNVARDQRVRSQLRKLGWTVMVVWECQIDPKNSAVLASRLRTFLA